MNIRRVAIIGAGVMGSGIAQVVAQAGFEVAVRSRRGIRGLDRLHENLEKSKNKKALTDEQIASILANVSWTTDLGDAVKEADLVIEAVTEDLGVKKDVFEKTDILCAEHTILASNTSSLSMGEISSVTKRTDKVVGTHFFNPVPVMKLVEVVPTSLTSKETVESIIEFVEKLGKRPLIVKDSPGFVVNRILIPMINEATCALAEGVAAADVIDSAMKLGANHPIGPLALADLIGIDVCLRIMQEFYEKFGDPKYRPCPLLQEMMEKGNLGRKSGKGFHTYNYGYDN